MGFVKTPDEVARIRAVLRQPRFVASEMLMVEYLTRPQAIAAVLPPGFEPVSEPTVTAMVGRWRSNCVGGAKASAGGTSSAASTMLHTCACTLSCQLRTSR